MHVVAFVATGHSMAAAVPECKHLCFSASSAQPSSCLTYLKNTCSHVVTRSCVEAPTAGSVILAGLSWN